MERTNCTLGHSKEFSCNECRQKKPEDQDIERRQALSMQDSKTYTKLCDELGITPEDKHLYEVGKLELKQDEEVNKCQY